MKYKDPELIERLSAEFVLGTLQGKARDRFEQLMVDSPQIRKTVWKWENHLTPIANMEPGNATPHHLWPSIKSRISNVVVPISAAAPAAKKDSSNKVSGVWRWWGITATAASILLAVVLATSPVIQNVQEPAIDSVAVFSDKEAQPQWLVSFDMTSGQLKAKALNEIAVQAGKAFELWVLPGSGNPKSLGLLPVSTTYQSEVPLPQALVELLSTANGLAVSIEPTGGSPTGLPTGPIAYQSKIIEL